MKSLLLALLLPLTALGQSSKQMKETRIPLAVLPSPVDSSGNDTHYTKLCKRVRAVELQQAATLKAICDYRPTTAAISIQELCLLITSAVRFAAADTTKR